MKLQMPDDMRPPPEIEEEDGDDITIEEDDEFSNPLEDFLVTENGENIATGIVNAIDRVARLIDTQNKIFIKMYTVLTKISETKV